MDYTIIDHIINDSNVEVICGGSGIAWNDDIDISEYELWEGGTEL